MSRAMARCNYNHLNFPGIKGVQEIPMKRNPLKLEEACLRGLVRSVAESIGQLKEAVQTLPEMPLEGLLVTAMVEGNHKAVTEIISAWPFKTLCFRRLLPASQHALLQNIFLGCAIFQGVIQRREGCKMTCLDFTGINLGEYFVGLLLRLPLMSFSPSSLSRKSLRVWRDKASNTVGPCRGQKRKRTNADVTEWNDDDESVHRCLEDLLIVNQRFELTQHLKTRLSYLRHMEPFHIKHLQGSRLQVKLESVTFCLKDSMYMDYLVNQSLKDITPLYFQTSVLEMADRDYLRGRRTSPFMKNCSIAEMEQKYKFFHTVLDCTDAEMLEGLFIEDTCFMTLHKLLPTIKQFRNLKMLRLQEAGLSRQDHSLLTEICCKTHRDMVDADDQRVVMEVRVNLLSWFPNLLRLHLGDMDIVGCLGVMLDSLATPLQYLGLQNLELEAGDMEALASSRHAGALLELDATSILDEECSLCHNKLFGNAARHYLAPSGVAFLNALRNMPQLKILNLSSTLFGCHSFTDAVFSVLKECLQELKMLTLSLSSADLGDPALVTRLSQVCADHPALQRLDVVVPGPDIGPSSYSTQVPEKLPSAFRNKRCRPVQLNVSRA
ncbi:hypothetical protein ACOMHN_011103 [Nucella lapillus]